MERQLPVALQAALYVASLAIVVSVPILVGTLLRFRKQLERVVGAVEELGAEMKPLAQEARLVVDGLRDLSGRAQEQWTEVEGIIDTARHWTERADHLMDEIGSAVGPPIFAATHGIRLLRRGLGVFAQVLLNRNQLRQRKARES
jgi:hypothetical protein